MTSWTPMDWEPIENGTWVQCSLVFRQLNKHVRKNHISQFSHNFCHFLHSINHEKPNLSTREKNPIKLHDPTIAYCIFCICKIAKITICMLFCNFYAIMWEKSRFLMIFPKSEKSREKIAIIIIDICIFLNFSHFSICNRIDHFSHMLTAYESDGF